MILYMLSMFSRTMGMTVRMFRNLLSLLSGNITKSAYQPAEILAMTLRHVKTGDSHRKEVAALGVSLATLTQIIQEVF